jgi:HEAT repeat protein
MKKSQGGLSSLSTCALYASWALALAACANSPAMRAADADDRAALKQALVAQQAAGTLSNGEAASIAERVARRELRDASPADAPDRVRDVLPCARELDGALAERMRVRDGGGADAALARIAGRGMSLGTARAFAADADSRWRAVGVRALVREEDREARERALVDADPGVRRQAARAALEAADPADLAALAEAARVDPEPMVRTEAVRAIAAIRGPAAGKPGVADLLRDLWTSADEALRGDIAVAWASPWIWDAGGREALRTLVAAGHGPGAIEGAAAILRRGDADADTTQSAVGQLVRAIAGGSHATRLQAIAQAPLDRAGSADLVRAVRRAASEEDLEVRVGALARLASLRPVPLDIPHDTPLDPGASKAGDEPSGAIAALEGLAQPGSPVSERARFALAMAGDRRVQAWIEAELQAAHPDERLGAAVALASLGVASRAAPLLADPDPSVRARGACTIVMAARPGR